MNEQANPYAARINRALDYIERHLDRALTLEELASVAAFSPFHFHRIFAACLGEPLGRYIARVRLERAASQLVHNPGKTVTEIALDSGYSSSATFARAFREAFGMTALEWRRRRRRSDDGTKSNLGKPNSKSGNPQRNPGNDFLVEGPYYRDNTSRWRVRMENTSIEAKVEVRELQGCTVAYVRHVGPYQGNDKLFAELFGKLFRWAEPRGLFRPGDTRVMAVYHDDPEITEETKLRVSACITVPEETPVDGEVGKMTIPGGKYAVAHFEMGPQDYTQAWQSVYGGWLPKSGYQPDDRPAFELYYGSPEEHPEGKHVVDICVPVRPL